MIPTGKETAELSSITFLQPSKRRLAAEVVPAELVGAESNCVQGLILSTEQEEEEDLEQVADGLKFGKRSWSLYSIIEYD